MGIVGKTIVLTGSMEPARFKVTDAAFNVGYSVAAVQVLPPGVYIAMNGRIPDPQRVAQARISQPVHGACLIDEEAPAVSSSYSPAAPVTAAG